MKIALIVLSIFCLSPALRAQMSAADPKAINFTGIMDTLAVAPEETLIGFSNNLNVHDQNRDSWEDMMIAYGPDESSLRLGGPWLFDSVANPQIEGQAWQYGDFNGDGIGDIIDHDCKFHKGLGYYPYFDSAGGAFLTINGQFFSTQIGAIDFNGDGILDFMIGQQTTPQSYIALYDGKPSFGTDSIYQHPDDSLAVGGKIQGGCIGQINPSCPPVLFFYTSTNLGNNIGLIHSQTKLSADTVTWLTDTSVAPEINVQGLLVTDITGDGIPDLLVSDGNYVYVFKGGDDFGSYKLSPDKAYYRIPNPRLIDLTGTFAGVNDFGKSYGEDSHSMFALGDLSGSGIPYVMIQGTLDEGGVARCYCMIYAGGKAVDSLYDGLIIYNNAGVCPVDTLHSIDSSGRSVAMIVHNSDPDFNLGDIDNLLYRDCDNLPHRTNPNLPDAVVKTSGISHFGITPYPSVTQNYVKLRINSSKAENGKLRIYDLLGRTVAERSVEIDPDESIQYFDTRQYASGVYVARLVTTFGERASVKFVVRR